MSERLVQDVDSDDETESAIFSGLITPMPGCPDVAISHALYKHPGSAPGLGLKANLERCKQLGKMGYSAVICTVERDNAAQQKILRKAGWQCLTSFRNKRTDHVLDLWMKSL